MSARSGRRSTPSSNRDTTGGPPRLDLSELNAGARPMFIRFAFGFAASALAGILGQTFGAHLGGVFLAFPAILPAALTLLEQGEGADRADADAWGAVAGAVGMVAFAVAGAALLTRLTGMALVGASAAWLLAAAAAWWGLEAVWAGRRNRR